MSMQVRLYDLASARHLQLSVRMSAVVSMSMNQTSSFEESCLSNVGISWSMVMVRFDSLCVVCKISVYVCMVLSTGSSLGWGAGWSIMVRCCFLSVSYDSSAAGVDWGMVHFKLMSWSLSWPNFSSSLAKGWQVSVSSEYSSDDSLSPSSIGCSFCARSKGAEF